jgi:hypothetical protein
LEEQLLGVDADAHIRMFIGNYLGMQIHGVKQRLTSKCEKEITFGRTTPWC